MSPLIHKSTTWTIVSAVVLTAAWLAASVQNARDQGSLRMRLVQHTVPQVAPAAPALRALAPAHAALPKAKTPVHLAAADR